jgi:hypothetical protein
MSDEKKSVEAQIRLRFFGLMAILTLEPHEFATKLGTKLQRIQDIERKPQAVPQDLLTAAVEVFHVDGHWLLTGEGNTPFKPQGSAAEVALRSAYERRTKFEAEELRKFSAEQLKVLFPRGLDYDPGKAAEDEKTGTP